MPTSILKVKGIGPATAEKLVLAGFTSAEDLAAASPGKVSGVPGFAESRAALAVACARQALADATLAVGERKTANAADGAPEPVTGQNDNPLKEKTKKKENIKEKAKKDKPKKHKAKKDKAKKEKAKKEKTKKEKAKKEKVKKEKVKKEKVKKAGKKNKAKKKSK